MNAFILSFLVACLSMGSAMAANTSIPDWIQPGAEIVLLPVTGTGSITIAVTQDRRLVFCGAEPDANNHTPVPGHCNVPISKPGFAFPVAEFMKGQSGFSTDVKTFLRAVAGVTVLVAPAVSTFVSGPTSYGVAAAQGVGSVWNPSPIQTIHDSAELANSIKRVILFGSEKDCGVPTVPVANTYENMKDNLINRMNKIAEKMIKQSQNLNVPSEGLDFALDGHQFVSETIADPNRPQTEEDQVQAMMDEIDALRMKNIVQPAIAAGQCRYRPVALKSQSIAEAAPAAAATDSTKELQAAPAAIVASQATAHVAGPAD